MDKPKLTVNYPIRFSAETYGKLLKIASAKTWRMSDTVRIAVERGIESLNGRRKNGKT